MASVAQILANRRNAERSTGPRTEEGKAAASRNATKHGLLGKRDIISSEDPAEFDRHRELMLADLDPAGPIEHVLADWIISLSWRLKRVERMQNEALDCLVAGEEGGLEGENEELGSFGQDGEFALGRAAVRDFAGGRVLERLMIYERRIECSLYKTMNELHRMKLLRPFDDGHRAKPPEPVGREAACRGIPQPATPQGVTTNGPAFQTNPMWAAGGAAVLVDGEGGDRYRGSPDH
jgi:hypothetical protein